MARGTVGKKVTIMMGLAIGLGAVAAGSFVLGIPSATGAAAGPGAGAPKGALSPTYVDVHPSPSPVALSDCATTDFSVLDGNPGDTGPLVGEVNTDYDSDTRIDRLTVFDSAKGEDVSFYVSVDDLACSKIPAISGRIAADMAMAAEVLQLWCADSRSHLAGAPLDPSEIADGMTFNPAAAQHFLDEDCSGQSAAPVPTTVP